MSSVLETILRAGGYLAMIGGAAGAIVPFFFMHLSESVAGFAAFAMAAAGLLFGSAIRPRPSTQPPASDTAVCCAKAI
jgi:hypothetical protein